MSTYLGVKSVSLKPLIGLFTSESQALREQGIKQVNLDELANDGEKSDIHNIVEKSGPGRQLQHQSFRVGY